MNTQITTETIWNATETELIDLICEITPTTTPDELSIYTRYELARELVKRLPSQTLYPLIPEFTPEQLERLNRSVVEDFLMGLYTVEELETGLADPSEYLFWEHNGMVKITKDGKVILHDSYNSYVEYLQVKRIQLNKYPTMQFKVGTPVDVPTFIPRSDDTWRVSYYNTDGKLDYQEFNGYEGAEAFAHSLRENHLNPETPEQSDPGERVIRVTMDDELYTLLNNMGEKLGVDNPTVARWALRLVLDPDERYIPERFLTNPKGEIDQVRYTVLTDDPAIYA